jgi:glycine cleavage system H protein
VHAAPQTLRQKDRFGSDSLESRLREQLAEGQYLRQTDRGGDESRRSLALRLLNPDSPEINVSSSPVPPDLKYTESHEWLRKEPDGSYTIGITEHAQEELGELVYVELPDVGRKLAREEACCVVESTKAASDVYAPLAGEVLAVNESLRDAPQTVNEKPFSDGWLFRLKPADPADLGGLISAADYTKAIEG